MFSSLEKYLLSENNLEKEFSQKILESQDIFFEIYKVCNNKFDFGVGSYLFDGKTYDYCEKMFQKQILLYKVAKESEKVLEIGTYMGHSLFIMLLANPNLKITCVDIDSTFTKPAVELLNKIFETNILFLEGNSLDVLNYIEGDYDLFHIDGTHKIDFVQEEFNLCTKLTSTDTFKVVFDDYGTVQQMGKIISDEYKILEYIKPDCEWNNAFFKIKL